MKKTKNIYWVIINTLLISGLIWLIVFVAFQFLESKGMAQAIFIGAFTQFLVFSSALLQIKLKTGDGIE